MYWVVALDPPITKYIYLKSYFLQLKLQSHTRSQTAGVWWDSGVKHYTPRGTMVCSMSLHVAFIMQDPWWDITIGYRNLCHNTPNREGVFHIKNYRFWVAFHEKEAGIIIFRIWDWSTTIPKNDVKRVDKFSYVCFCIISK